MAPKTLITCLENILPAFSTNIRHALNLSNRTVFTNKYASTLHKHREEIEDIRRLKNSIFVENYCSVVDRLRQGVSKDVGAGGNGLVLLIGEPSRQMLK